ncbi:MAG: FMN-binding protein [Coprococcus sp.]
MKTLLKGKEATADTVDSWDSVSGATRTSKAVKEAAAAAIKKAEEKTTAVEVKTEKLQEAITKAEGLTEADYTAESWAKLQTALTEAKTAFEAKESQDTGRHSSRQVDSSNW